MQQKIVDNYIEILTGELIPALGCTEPIAIAFAAAKAREALGNMPEKIEIQSSGNIIKNVKGVTVPNSGGLKGIDIAAILGVVGGDAQAGLEVLQGITPSDIAQAEKLAQSGYCSCRLMEQAESLYLLAKVFCGEDDAEVEIRGKHTNITRISKNGKNIFLKETDDRESGKSGPNKELLNVKDILTFADTVELSRVEDVIGRQIELNSAIAAEGIKNSYGANVGKMILEYYGSDVKHRAAAKAAAGSDARMSGCSLPVVINSGSGNQGMTVSLPIIEYAQELGVSQDKLYRALLVGNLISIHQKRYIGSLSAYCGAVCASTGAACGIAYLQGGGYEVISQTIINVICNIGGMVCDGAKPSCAAKIASAVEAGILSAYMASKGEGFSNGEGLVKEDVEKTIQSVGRMAKVGMASTDIEILNIMLES